MWAAAVAQLRLSPADFWDLTFEEFEALWKAYEAQQDLENYRAGIIAALLYNIHRGKNQKPLGWEDFFGGRRRSGKQKQGMTHQQMIAAMDAWAKAVTRR
jgi:hypothetical protein